MNANEREWEQAFHEFRAGHHHRQDVRNARRPEHASLFASIGVHSRREISELTDAVTKHNPWTSGKKFMLAPFNLIGATGLEAALLGGYADHMRRHSPNDPHAGRLSG